MTVKRQNVLELLHLNTQSLKLVGKVPKLTMLLHRWYITVIHCNEVIHGIKKILSHCIFVSLFPLPLNPITKIGDEEKAQHSGALIHVIAIRIGSRIRSDQR